MSESLFDALQVLARDSMESSLDEIRARDDDGEITVAFQTVLREVERLDALTTAAREVAAFEQAGGDDWWGAHDKLYRAAGIEVER